MSQSRKQALVLSSFSDKGTGEDFVRGATVSIEAGTFANYEAAGLVCPAPAKATASWQSKRKAKPKPKDRNAAPARPKPSPPPSEPIQPISEPAAAKETADA